MIRFGYLLAALVLVACSSRDEQFCECLTKGETLNEYTQQFFDKAPTSEEAKKLEDLKNAKTEACANYQTMDGPEMIKRKKECGFEE